MRLTVILLLVGLVVGGAVGFITRPDAAELKLGGVSIEVQTARPAAPGTGSSITTGQWRHIGAFAIGGAILGALAGFVADRRRV